MAFVAARKPLEKKYYHICTRSETHKTIQLIRNVSKSSESIPNNNPIVGVKTFKPNGHANQKGGIKTSNFSNCAQLYRLHWSHKLIRFCHPRKISFFPTKTSFSLRFRSTTQCTNNASRYYFRKDDEWRRTTSRSRKFMNEMKRKPRSNACTLGWLQI